MLHEQGGPYGEFAAFDDASMLATWLDDEGYRTALFGKYLNGYGRRAYVPPGWDRWFATFDNGSFYDASVASGTTRSSERSTAGSASSAGRRLPGTRSDE